MRGWLRLFASVFVLVLWWLLWVCGFCCLVCLCAGLFIVGSV